jgi:hypothetical protein
LAVIAGPVPAITEAARQLPVGGGDCRDKPGNDDESLLRKRIKFTLLVATG